MTTENTVPATETEIPTAILSDEDEVVNTNYFDDESRLDLDDEWVDEWYDEYIMASPRPPVYRRNSEAAFDTGWMNLGDVFAYADILACTYNDDDETVGLVVRTRRNDEVLTFTGDTLNDVVSDALDRLEYDDYLITMICEDYEMTVEEIRDLVAPRVEHVTPEFDPIVVSAAQPLYFIDRDDKVYIGAYIPTPID